MTPFTLPSDFKFNRGVVTDPSAYAKESGCASWLFLVGDEFASMPGGISYDQVQTAMVHTGRVISDPPRALTIDLARQQVEAIDRMPRPVLMTCRSGPRASAAAYLYAGLKAGASYDEVIAAAERDEAPLCKSQEIKDWLRASLDALRDETR